jgi:hypothetical protein
VSADADGLCSVREWSLGEALDAYQALFMVSSTQSAGGHLLWLAAIENVIAERMRAHATIDIHRALLAGVLAEEIAHVLGVELGDLADRWQTWADGQLHLHGVFPALGICRPEYEEAARALGGTGAWIGRDDLDRFPACACASTSPQIGSPRP